MQKHIVIVACLFVCGLLMSCHQNVRIEDPLLAEACSLLWSDGHRADSLAQSIDRMSLSPYEQHRLSLLEAHIGLKLRQSIPATTNLQQLAEWFHLRDDDGCAAEALYIAGAYANWTGDNTEAMRCLKEAERLHPDGIIAGMTLYKMGRISETEQLYDVAADYYERCIGYIDASELPYYQACAWRELGRTRSDSTTSDCFRRALYYARQIGDSLLCLDIRYAAANLDPTGMEAITISRLLCDSAGINRYAYDLVKHYIRTGDAPLARHYLDIFARDTLALQWSSAQYRLWESRYWHLCRQDEVAYEQLLALFNELYDRTEQENRTQTYAIAQRYDNEAERAKNLQLQLEKQHLYFSLAAIVAVVLLAIILGIVIFNRRRTRHLLEKAESELQINQLRNELQLRREALRRVLEQRVSLTKNLQETVLHKHKEEDLPEWAQEFVQQNIFSTGEQWQIFLDEFNGCYSNLLTRLQTEYPSLTSSDLQVIALVIIGLDIADICLLLGLTKRTIWSRRLHIRQRLLLEEGVVLDDWLRSLAFAPEQFGKPSSTHP